MEFLAAVVDHVDPERRFPFHAGVEITMAGGWGNLLGELLAHGDDIARATGVPFTIPGPDLEILWRFAAPVLDGWLRAESRRLDESWDLELGFGPVRMSVVDGHLDIDDHEPRRVHRVVAIEDTTVWTLTFPYRRRPFTDPTSALLASRFHDL